MKRPLLAMALAVATLAAPLAARAATTIDFFFPVPVQGTLAVEMQKLIGEFNTSHPDIHVTGVYTGSYDDTDLKTRAAIKAGHPPAVALMSANFIRNYAIMRAAMPLDRLISAEGTTDAAYMKRFFPALLPNAVIGGHVYAIPFQNSTPLLFYSVDAFRQAGLDPNKPPQTWAEWYADAKKLTVVKNGQTERWGMMMPETSDYLGWIMSGLVMANGGQWWNHEWGGEVYYNQPSTIGALTFLDDMIHKAHVMPASVTDANATTTAFFSGHAAMMILSTGALGFVRHGMKQPYRTAFLPGEIGHAAPIGGGSLLIPAGNSAARQQAAWTFIEWLTSPTVAGRWSRFTGYFAPNRAAYELPAMKAYLAQHPNATVAIRQLRYAVPWFDTYDVVGVRKALENEIQALIVGRETPAVAAERGQKAAEALLAPYVKETALQVP
ncbi:MAG: ABC transporter substrate-binding protein [Rhodospirillales bacterium]|nr:ABC transporter substrate-binding protein [Rhodospirillales bacterium]